MISMQAKYSIRALLYLAKHRGAKPVTTKDIAQSEAIPRKFLEAILVDLRNAGLVKSRLGKAGGYTLERRPDTITLSTVLRLVDGPIAQVPCVSQLAYAPCPDCPGEHICVLRTVMKQVRDSTAKILDHTTFQDLLDRETTLRASDPDFLEYQI
ncbi:MAG: Rrf2 family transcriptional regulator [Verrucomicrobiales bacterium]|jgi:Rrf2 family protein|nr:Rrf2 family transcriptional regulator [Verrucomicrobiales bacterium]